MISDLNCQSPLGRAPERPDFSSMSEEELEKWTEEQSAKVDKACVNLMNLAYYAGMVARGEA